MLKRALPFFIGTAIALVIFVAGFSVGSQQGRYFINDGRILDTRTGTMHFLTHEGVTWVQLDGKKGSFRLK